MTLLELVQSLHREAQLPGSAPAATAGLTGRAADLVRWIVEAYKDIQRERDGKWRWLLRDCHADFSGGNSFPSASAVDTALGTPVSRFKAWELDKRNPPFIYKTADGVATRYEMTIFDWATFRRCFLRGDPSASPGPPQYVTVDPHGLLTFSPYATADFYRIETQHWRGVQTLAVDADEPEMPADYHMLIVYRAMLKYGYRQLAQEILSAAALDAQPLYEALSGDQSYSRFSLKVAGPLA